MGLDWLRRVSLEVSLNYPNFQFFASKGSPASAKMGCNRLILNWTITQATPRCL